MSNRRHEANDPQGFREVKTLSEHLTLRGQVSISVRTCWRSSIGTGTKVDIKTEEVFFLSKRNSLNRDWRWRIMQQEQKQGRARWSLTKRVCGRKQGAEGERDSSPAWILQKECGGLFHRKASPEWGTHDTRANTSVGWDRDSVSIIPPLIFDEAKKKVSVDADQSRTCSPWQLSYLGSPRGECREPQGWAQ